MKKSSTMNVRVKKTLMNAVVGGTLTDVQSAFKKYKMELDDSYFDYKIIKAAMGRKHTKIILFLLSIGCRVKNPHKSDSEETPLHLAMKLNTKVGRCETVEEIIQELLDKGASVYDKNANGDTPLYGAFKGHCDNSKAIYSLFSLMKSDFHPENIDDQLHFHIACVIRHDRAIQRFLKCGIDPNKPMRLSCNDHGDLNPIQMSIMHDDFTLYKRLIKYGDLSVKNAEGFTYLHMIYYSRYPKIGKAWIKRAFRLAATDKGFVNVENKQRLSHFHLSCLIGEPDYVQAFIDNGANVNKAVVMKSDVNPGYAPLHFAVESGNKKVVAILLKNGADPNKGNADGSTPLHLACEKTKNSRFIKKLLMDHQASPIVANRDGYTPLHTSVYNAKKDGIPNLDAALSRANWGSSNLEDCQGMSLFHVACTTSNVKRVKQFLDAGASVDDRVRSGAYSGFTALHFAVMYGQKNVVELLLRRRARVNVKVHGLRLTPLHLACEYVQYMNLDEEKTVCKSRTNQLEIIRLLLSHGARVDVEDWLALTPLLCTCMVVKTGRRLSYSSVEEMDKLTSETTIRFEETVRMLVSSKANIKARNCNESTILHIICECETLRISENFMDFLVHSGLDVDAVNDSGITALHIAARFGNKNMIKHLLRHNANPNIACMKSKTPLHVVAKRIVNIFDRNENTVYIFEELLNHGADINMNYPYTSYLLERESDHEESRDERSSPWNGKLLRIIFVHINKLMALKLHVSEGLQEIFTELKEVFEEEFKSFFPENIYDKCVEELDAMRKVKLDKYTSLYDILQKNPHELATHVKNRDLIEILEGGKADSDFPRYACFLRLQYKRGVMRGEAMRSAEDSLKNILNVNLPNACCDLVLRYLENKDIANLKEAAQPKAVLKRKLGGRNANEVETVMKLQRKTESTYNLRARKQSQGKL